MDDASIVRKLLRHTDIDVSPVNKTGLTPIIMATKKGKIKALEVSIFISLQTRANPKPLQALLEDPRINPDEVDEEGNNLEDLIGSWLSLFI